MTKVASAAEEVDDPSLKIPLGMSLSLFTATVLYTLGALVAVALLPPDLLHEDLAPIHSAAESVLPSAGVALVVLAALAAFASAVNAGILAAARYPMAMARDGLLPEIAGRLSRYGTPAFGVIATGVAIALVVLLLDAESIAKLASAFVLLTLGLLNIAVLVLRASHIRSYAPAFKAPFYPLTQFAGIAISVFLISQLGLTAFLFVLLVFITGWTWHRLYATGKSKRAGAIRQVFERWGADADPELDREMSAAMAGHGLRTGDDYPGLIARAGVLSVPAGTTITEAADRAAIVLSDLIGLTGEKVTEQFLETGSLWIQPSEQHPTATPVALFDAIDEDQLVIVRASEGIRIPASWGGSGEWVNALFFLAGTTGNPGRSLRVAGELASHLHTGAKLIGLSQTEAEVKSALLPEMTFRQYTLLPEGKDSAIIGSKITDLNLVDDVEVVSLHREGILIDFDIETILEADDQVTLLGPSDKMPSLGEPLPVKEQI